MQKLRLAKCVIKLVAAERSYIVDAKRELNLVAQVGNTHVTDPRVASPLVLSMVQP